MQCPNCQKDALRVVTMFACSCGHHSIACGECLKNFTVECGEPEGAGKLPPEHALTPDERFDKTRSEGEFAMSDDDYRAILATMPTVEEFKATLAEGD